MTLIAGPYTVTYNSQVLGIIEDAWSLEITPSVDSIQGDNLGDSVQDGVYRGGNCFLDFVLQEFDAAAARLAFWPYNSIFGDVGQVGTLQSSFAKTLVLTAVAGTTAFTEGPKTITSTDNCVLAANFPIRMLFGSRLRSVPIRFQLLPYDHTHSGGTAQPVFFVTVAPD